MFNTLTLRGASGSIVWAYHTAAQLTAWSIRMQRDELTRVPVYTLRAALGGRVNRFELRQRPLLFTAPRTGHFGLWCWPVRGLTVGESSLVADLGPPEY